MKISIIANPAGGAYNEDLLAECRKFLSRKFGPTSVRYTSACGDGKKIASVVDADMVIAAGGDGMINEVASGLYGRKDILFSAIAMGTRNVFCLEHNIALNPIEAIHKINPDKIKHIPVGFLGNHPFVLMCGFGYDAEVVKRVVTKNYTANKTFAHIKEGFRALFTNYPALEIFANAAEYRAYHVIVSLVSKYAGNYRLSGYNDDNMLNIYMIKRKSNLSICYSALRMGFHTGFGAKPVISELVKVSGISHAQVDGEYLDTGLNHNYITLEKDALRLVC